MLRRNGKPSFVSYSAVKLCKRMTISLGPRLLVASSERPFPLKLPSQGFALAPERVYHTRVLPRAEYGSGRIHFRTLFTFHPVLLRD